jgi:orotidine-5'-phosphate decarboxylase
MDLSLSGNLNSASDSSLSDLASSDPRNRLAVALDFPAAQPALEFVDRLDGACRWLKVGMELYYSAGNPLLETLRARGFSLFLDLKLHDIPNTVAGAVRSVTQSGASLLTIHAGGGEAMIRAAAAAAAVPGAPQLLAVTVLTSMDAEQLHGIGVSAAPAQQVLQLARLAAQAGGERMGMVCSAEEVGLLRAELGPATTLVVPGIRPAGAALGDQRRVATPATAITAGATMLVVGRPITQAADPAAAARAILAEIAGAISAESHG